MRPDMEAPSGLRVGNKLERYPAAITTLRLARVRRVHPNGPLNTKNAPSAMKPNPAAWFQVSASPR